MATFYSAEGLTGSNIVKTNARGDIATTMTRRKRSSTEFVDMERISL